MDSDEDDYSELNESKFMTEQVNWDEQPTEQEIIEKAEELAIDDYSLAKEALLKELDPQWKPYVNRHGHIYYINLEDKKAYTDHPIDMEYKITYALKYKKKLPQFKQFKLAQVSEDPRIIIREIAEYEKQKGLKIVYEESDEESIRRNTMRSNQDEDREVFKEETHVQMQRELEQYRLEQEREMKRSVAEYRKQREGDYRARVKQHEEHIVQLKKARLQDIGEVYSSEVEEKNQANYQKSVESHVLELQQKKVRFEDLLQKEQQLTQQLHSFTDIRTSYRRLAKKRIINAKCKQRDEYMRQLDSDIKKRIMEEVYQAKKEFDAEVEALTRSRINYQEIYDTNMADIINKQPQTKTKRRYSIFLPETFAQKNTYIQKGTYADAGKGARAQSQNFKIEHEEVWSAYNYDKTFVLKARPCLWLKLAKKLL